MKRMLSILMALLLLWSLALPAAAAETASTLRLEKTEGTVKVSNASGKSVSITGGMRLYSGYTIATGKNSYAYVSLDSTKAVKLDASSKVEVQKSGKKLELMLISGELFFNVTAPVEKDESLNIRTSTMVTGVRGTSGWVTVTNRFTSSVHLLEGSLTVTSAEPATGQMRQAVITGGQTATATLTGQAQSGSQMALTVTTLQEKQVPGFVAVEVKKDPALQQKITAKSPLSVPEIIGDAEERLEAEQAAADLAQKEIKKQVESIGVEQAERGEQVFENPAARDDDDDVGGSEAPPVTSTGITKELENPSVEVLNATLSEPGVTRVNVTGTSGGGDDSVTVVVQEYQTLNIRSGTFTVGSNTTLNVAGSLINSEESSITIQSTDSIHVTDGGTLENNGTINVGGLGTAGLEEFPVNGKLVIESGSTLENNGIINVYGFKSENEDEVPDEGFVIQSGGILNNNRTISLTSGTMTNAGTINNNGDFSVSGGEFIQNGGNLTASSDAVTVESSGKLTMTGGTVTSTGGTGIHVTGGSVEISGGKVSSENGTGIKVTTGSVTISGNAEVEGATYGILNEGQGNVTISGGTVTLTADPPGDGQYAVSGLAELSSGAILRAKSQSGHFCELFELDVNGEQDDDSSYYVFTVL